MTAPMKIGFVGLGSMGGKLAACLVPIGNLTVFDVDDAKMERFRERGSIAASSIAEVGVDADAVGICVRNDEQVDECVDALLPVMKPGSVVMIHSTVAVNTIKNAAARGEAHGVSVIDSSVTVVEYENYGVEGLPFVYSLTGGDKEISERVRPLLEAYSAEWVNVGPVGAGVSLKIINNLVSLVETMLSEEAFRIAARTSVPADILAAVMTRNGALTPGMAWMARRTGESPPGRDEQIQREIQATNGVKDLALAEDLAKGVYTASSIASFAKANYWFAMTAPGPTGAW